LPRLTNLPRSAPLPSAEKVTDGIPQETGQRLFLAG
jgi:hypothetical protein